MLLVGLALAAGCGDRTPRAVRRKEHVATLRPDIRQGSLIASEDGKHTAYIVGQPGASAVLTDGKLGPGYADCSWVWLARGGGDLRTYFARDHDHRFFLVAGADTVPIGFTKRDWLAFTPDGTGYALLASPPPPVEDPGRRATIIRDGKVIGAYADASAPHFDAAGRSLTYLVDDPTSGTVLMKDGVEVRRFPHSENSCTVTLPPPEEGPGLPRLFEAEFLSDGRIVAMTTDADGWAVYRDGERLASYPVIAPGAAAELTFSIEAPECQGRPAVSSGSMAVATSAPVAAWWARQANDRPEMGARWQVVRDGVPIGPETCLRPWDAQRPVLSANGASVVFPCVVAATGAVQTMFVVHDHRWYGPYADVWGLAISDDGRHVAFAATYGDGSDDWRLHIDGRPNRERYIGLWRPRFSPDGLHLAWQAQRTRNGSNVLGIDRVPLTGFGDVVAGPTFAPDGAAVWVIRRGKRVRRLEVKLP